LSGHKIIAGLVFYNACKWFSFAVGVGNLVLYVLTDYNCNTLLVLWVKCRGES